MNLKQMIVGIGVMLLFVGCNGGRIATEKGDEFLSQGDFTNAIIEYEKVLESDPDNMDAHSGIVIADVLWVISKVDKLVTNSLLTGALGELQTDETDIFDIVLPLAGINDLAELTSKIDEMDEHIRAIEKLVEGGTEFIREVPPIPVKIGNELNSLMDLYVDVKISGRIGFPELEAIGAVVSLARAIINSLNAIDTILPSDFLTTVLAQLDSLSERLENDPVGLIRILPAVLSFDKNPNFLCWNSNPDMKARFSEVPTDLALAMKRLMNVLKKRHEVFGPNPVSQDGYLVALVDNGDGELGGGNDASGQEETRDYLKVNVIEGEARDLLDRDFDDNTDEIITYPDTEFRIYLPAGFNEQVVQGLEEMFSTLYGIFEGTSADTTLSIADLDPLLYPLGIVRDADDNVVHLPDVIQIDIEKLLNPDGKCLRKLLFVEKEMVDPYDNQTKIQWMVEGETLAGSMPGYATSYVKTVTSLSDDVSHFVGTSYEIESDGAIPVIEISNYPSAGFTSAVIYTAMKDPTLNGALKINLCPLRDFPGTSNLVSANCTDEFVVPTQLTFNNLLAAIQIIFEKPYLKIVLPNL